MILADTSIWVDHLRRGRKDLAAHLLAGRVACHAFVIGELACGNLKNRSEVLSLLARLELLPVAEHAEVLDFIDHHALMGRGIGWVDVHLLASAMLARAVLWTDDRRLGNLAHQLGVGASR